MDRSLLSRWAARAELAELLALTALAALAALTAAGCSFYAPSVSDCSLRCAPDGGCPSGTTCVGAFCQAEASPGTSTSASASASACECLVGETRSCGRNVGECRLGTQACDSTGAWSPCVGEVAPTPERCDEKDNDCDGLVDLGPVVELADDLSSTWRLHGTDAGYALVHTRAVDGGEALVVTWLDGLLTPTATSAPLRSGLTADAVTAMVGSTVYVAFATSDGGLTTLGVGPDGVVTRFASVPQADTPFRLHLGASEQLVANWVTSTGPPHARLARWHLDGGLDQVVDLDASDTDGLGLDVYGCNLSVQGHFSVYLADPSPAAGAYVDAGLDVMRFLQDTRTLEVLRVDVPYFGESFAKVIEQPAGAVTSTYTYIDTNSSWSGIFLSPDLRALGFLDEKTLDESKVNAFLWGDSDAALDRDGNLAIVYMDLGNRRLVLARSVGTALTAEVPVRQALAPADGYGSPRLAQSGADPMLGLAWSSGARISARRVCGAK